MPVVVKLFKLNNIMVLLVQMCELILTKYNCISYV